MLWLAATWWTGLPTLARCLSMSRWFVLLGALVFVGLAHADPQEEAIARGI